MKLTEEHKKQVAERLAQKTMVVLGGIQPTEEFLTKVYLKELTEMESETKEAETKKAEQATGTGSLGTFDY